MKTFLYAIAALGLSATVASADPVTGTWKTQPGETGGYAHVNITTCGDTICGTIQKVVGNGNSSSEGKRIIWNMKANGRGKYSGGKIWAPDNDKTYNSRMTLKGNTLEVKGCVLGLCRGQNWTRIN